MCQLNVCVLGQFTAQYQDRSPIRFVSLKEQELLSYLVLRRNRMHARELLAGILWGDTTTDRSKKNLRTELWRLRNDTTPPDGSRSLVTATKEWIRLNPEADIWSDVNVLESTYELMRGKPAERLGAQEVDLLDEAVRLYEGPLLDGWYHEWFQADRDRLHQIYLELTDKLMAYYEVFGHYDVGIALGLRVMREDQTRERTHRRLMRLYFHAGDRASALGQYGRCASILRDTLGIEPSAATRALQQQLRADSLESPVTGASRQDRVDLAPILQRVDELRQQLDGLRRQIEYEAKRTNPPYTA